MGKRGLRIVSALSGFGAARSERTHYNPVPKHALPTRYPAKQRLGDAFIDVANKNMTAKAEKAMKEWLAKLSAEEREAVSNLPDPERIFD
jgi:hypothetical protein